MLKIVNECFNLRRKSKKVEVNVVKKEREKGEG